MKLAEIREIMQKNLESATSFWLNNSNDKEYGGILHSLDRQGECFSLDKGVWMQGRCGWAFAHLYNTVEKNPEYLAFSESCIRFAREKCFDTDGRMFLTVTREGKPLSKSSDFFSEAFYVSANIEYYRATGEAMYLEEARRVFDMILGIHRGSLEDPYKISATGSPMCRPYISFNRPMILLNVNAQMASVDTGRVEYYNENALSLFEEIKKFYHEEYRATLEAIAPDGSVITESSQMRISNPGHDMECAWFLLEEGERLGNREMCNLGKRMFDSAYKMGWDEKHGGILYSVDILGAPVPDYEQDVKVWWVHNEAIIASLKLYLHTGDYAYKMILEELMEYCFSRFVDKDGEWYSALNRNGEPKEGMLKGFNYKGPFHTLRMYMKCIELLDGVTE